MNVNWMILPYLLNSNALVSALYGVKFGAALRKSDTYPEQFHIEKSKFTTLVGFTVLCSYRISLGNTKDEGLKELWRDFVIKNS